MNTPKTLFSRAGLHPYEHIKSSEQTVVKHHFSDAAIAPVKSWINLKDVLPIVTEILCLAVGILTVFWPAAAIWLGQVYQLVVVGFVLSLAALATEAVVLRTALISAGARSHVRLEDLDSILRKDAVASSVHLFYRILLLLLMATPIGLSAAYKTFIGGHTTESLHDGVDGWFGSATTPGKQRIGDGISLLVDVYLPFWIDPKNNSTYGYNLFVVDNTTAAVLDTPRPEYLSPLQASLKPGQSLQLTATVNATISQVANPSDEQRSNQTYWDNISTEMGGDPTLLGSNIFGQYNTLWTAGKNGSVVVASAWNTTKNETLYSEAIRTEQSRGLATGTWTITSENITLDSASLDLRSIASCDQTPIQDNALSIQAIFGAFIGEYDWHNRVGIFDYPYPNPQNVSEDRWYQPINTVPPLIASMFWARITSLDTIDRPLGTLGVAGLRNATAYTKARDAIVITKSVPSLKRSRLLLLVLLVNPALCFISMIIKAVLSRYSTVSENLNSISLARIVNENASLVSLRQVSEPGE